MKVFEANEKIQEGHYQEVQLKKRQPKSKNIYQFRITRKYRAFAIKENGSLIIFHISDHQ